MQMSKEYAEALFALAKENGIEITNTSKSKWAVSADGKTATLSLKNVFGNIVITVANGVQNV